MGPREVLLERGVDPLGDADLIAVLFGTGVTGKPAPVLASDLLHTHGGLGMLARAEPAAIARHPGVGPARAARVCAAIELGRRAIAAGVVSDAPVVTAKAAWKLLGPGLDGLEEEELHALYLDRRLRPLAQRVLTRGSDGFTVVDARQVFRPAVGLGAYAVVLAHNHPSGDPTPSGPDRDVTRRVAQAGKVLGIGLIDHIVVGRGRFCSLAEEGILAAWRESEPQWMASEVGGSVPWPLSPGPPAAR